MAKFIRVDAEYPNGDKFLMYINLETISAIQSDNGGTTVYFIGGENDYCMVDIPISEFMDLVNSAE